MTSPKIEASDLAKGAGLMVAAILLFSIMDTQAKILSANHHPLQIVWARYTSQTVFAFVLLAPRLATLLRTRYVKMQLVRSGFLFVATMGFFWSIALMPLATVTATFEIAPLFITILAFFILKEKVGPRRWVSVAIGFAGALIIIRPGSAVFTPYALLPALAAASFAGYAISTRFLGREESPWTSFLYTALIGTVISCIIVPFVWTNPSLVDGLRMVFLGVIGGVGHILLVRAFTLTEASYLAPFSYVGLLFNALWGLLFFAEVPGSNTIIGGTIIVGAGVYVWYREVFGTTKSQA